MFYFFSDFIISYTFECEPFFSIACQCFKVLIMIEIVVYALTRIVLYKYSTTSKCYVK